MRNLWELIDISLIEKLTAARLSEDKWLIAGSEVIDIVRKYNTPIFINDLQIIKSQCASFMDSFRLYEGDVSPFFAVKASSCPVIIEAIIQSGFGVDVVSAAELSTCLKLGVNPGNIIMNGNAKSDEQIEYVIS